MVIALCVVLLLIAVAIILAGLAVLLAPGDEPVALESRDQFHRWTVRPLRSDSRRLAGQAFSHH
jgi:hypothetical protein